MGINGCKCKCKDKKLENELDFNPQEIPKNNLALNSLDSQKKNLLQKFNKNGNNKYTKNERGLIDSENENNSNIKNKKTKTYSLNNDKTAKSPNISNYSNLEYGYLNERNYRTNNIKKRHRKSSDMIFQGNNNFQIEDNSKIIPNTKLTYISLNKKNQFDISKNYLEDPIFDNKICKEYFNKNHIYPITSNYINVYSFIELNNPLIHKNDETIFFSEINRVQITGKKIINKKLIPRFCSSTKREFRIYNTKEKYITLKKPIQILKYRDMKKSCFVEFDKGRETKRSLESDSQSERKEPYFFIIYLIKENFEMFSSDKIELLEKWVSLMNHLILKQEEYDKDDNQL